MDQLELLNTLTVKIEELNKTRNVFKYESKLMDNVTDLRLIDQKISDTKKFSLLFTICGLFLGLFLLVSAEMQVFGYSVINWNKAGLFIVMTLAFVANAFRYKILIEKLQTIKYLKQLKDRIAE